MVPRFRLVQQWVARFLPRGATEEEGRTADLFYTAVPLGLACCASLRQGRDHAWRVHSQRAPSVANKHKSGSG